MRAAKRSALMLSWLGLAIVISGCGDSFTPASLLAGLRLLVAKAEPPEAAPGDSVQFTAYAVDTQQRKIAIAWSACLLPPVAGMGMINNDCLITDRASWLIPLGSGFMITAKIPELPPSALLPPDITGGQYVPIRLRVTAQSDDDSGVYRLRLAGNMPRNQNPTLQSIDIVTEQKGQVVGRFALPQDAPYVVHAKQTFVLRAEFTSDSAEHYVVINGDGSRRDVVETLTAQWYATGGSLDNETSGADVDETLTLDKQLPPTGGVIDLWVAGHDERGGTDIMHRQLLLQ
jgi:hypothetical protein